MRAIPVIDVIRDDVMPNPNGAVVDESASDPTKMQPDTIYAWPRRLLNQKLEEANGRWSEADLRLRVLYTINAKGEPRVRGLSRTVSLALDELNEAVHDAVAANRRHPYWWDLYIDNVVFDAVHSFDVRGIGFDLVARLILPQAELSSGS